LNRCLHLLGKKVGSQIHSSEDSGKMEKNSRTRICSCLVSSIWDLGWLGW
jgi:hypothetical protein